MTPTLNASDGAGTAAGRAPPTPASDAPAAADSTVRPATERSSLPPTHREEAQPAGMEPRGLFSFNSGMLTTRGYWFFVVTFGVLAVAILIGAPQLTLLGATLLLWFLSRWFLFHLRVRMTIGKLTLERTVRTADGEATSLWARQKVDVEATLRLDGGMALPYLVMIERVPALARTGDDAVVCVDGPLAADSALVLSYSLHCPSAGWLRFEGVKVHYADLQGFFAHAAFVRDVQEYRVLPTLAVEPAHAAFVKIHNILPLMGTHRHARPGGGSELLDLRDYIPGDPPKMIAWKVSARRDRVITKELESEVPIRCTLFVDTSNSVRVGPVGGTALCKLVEIAAGVAQANASERDLTGLCLFDEEAVQRSVKPGRGPKHQLRMIAALTDVAGLTPHSPTAKVRELVRVAYGLAQDMYPEMLNRDANWFPWWLPLWSPQPNWTIPPGAPRDGSRFSPAYHREYRWRKELSAICSVRYGLGPGGLALLLEDDERCAHYLQRFLADHQVAFPFPLYDHRGQYLFAAPRKAGVLADALLSAVLRGKDNELFVLCVDLLEITDHLAKLERAVCVARAKHHQVVMICPWPAGVDAPGAKPSLLPPELDMRLALLRLCTADLHQAFSKVRHTFGRLGVPVICAGHGDSVSWILHRMRRLRVQERGVR